jgi:hypothetical protein
MVCQFEAIHTAMRISEAKANSIFFASLPDEKAMRAVTPQRVAFYISQVLNDK